MPSYMAEVVGAPSVVAELMLIEKIIVNVLQGEIQFAPSQPGLETLQLNREYILFEQQLHSFSFHRLYPGHV